MVYIIRRIDFLKLNSNKLSPIGITEISKEKNTYNKDNKKGYSNSFKPTAMIRGRAIVDLLRGYKRLKWKQIESFKLDEIGKKEFKIGKIEYSGWIGEFWKQDFQKFLEYNRRDIEICLEIERQYSVLDFLLNLRKITGCELSDVHFNSRMIDIYMLRKCNRRFVLPTKTYISKSDTEEKITGGFVLEPAVGVFENVAALDMKSLYPSIMLACNMSPENISDDGEIHIIGHPTNNVNFKTSTGILKELLLDLLGKRDDLRALLKTKEINSDPIKYLNIYKRQYAFKTFTNSLYGVTLYSNFRLFDPKIGSSITYVGRYLCEKIKELSDKKGYTVVRQDTDSAFIHFGNVTYEKALELGKDLEKEINGMFEEWFEGWNVDISYFSIKFEKLYGKLFSGSQKKIYSGKIIWDWEKGKLEDPEIEIKGLAAKRSDKSYFTRKLQKKILNMIFDDSCNEDIISYIKEEIDKFYYNNYTPEEIGVPKAIVKDISEYKVINPWLKGIKFSEENILGYQFSPKPYLIYIKNDPRTQCVCFDNSSQFRTLGATIDMEKMLDASVLKPLKNLLLILKIDETLIKSYIKTKINGQLTLF